MTAINVPAPTPPVAPAPAPRLPVPVRMVGTLHWSQPVLAALATMAVDEHRRHRNTVLHRSPQSDDASGT